MRPTMRFVELKSEAQSDLQSLRRARERLVAERTALLRDPDGRWRVAGAGGVTVLLGGREVGLDALPG